jgi:hypothetical protein
MDDALEATLKYRRLYPKFLGGLGVLAVHPLAGVGAALSLE